MKNNYISYALGVMYGTMLMIACSVVTFAPGFGDIHGIVTDQTAVLPTGTGDNVPKSRGFDKRLLAITVLLTIIFLGGFFGYRYLKPWSESDSIKV